MVTLNLSWRKNLSYVKKSMSQDVSVIDYLYLVTYIP